MALPTTNLTFHAKADVNTNVWKFYQAGTPFHNTNGVDGDNIESWDDADAKALSFMFQDASAQGATYKTATPLMNLSCLDFNGSSEMYSLFDDAGTANKVLSDIFTSTAKTLILSLYVKSATLNDANAFFNHGIFADTSQYFGLFLRTSGGVYYLQAYNYDGTVDAAEVTINLNTSYVVTVRHDGSSIYIGLDGGSETSVASGTTSVTTGRIIIGVNGAGTTNYSTAFADIRIGEIATWNAALTGTNLTDANAYFTSKWLAAAGGIIPRIMHHRKLMAA